MKRDVQRWLLFMAFASALLILFSAALSYRNARELRENMLLVAETHDTLTSLGDLLTNLVDAETGQRGFLITGDKGYLEPYESAMRSIADNRAEITGFAAKSAELRALLSDLESSIQGKLDELAHTIRLREEHGFEQSQAAVLTHLGRNRMNHIRDLIAQMRDHEAQVRRERIAANDRAYDESLRGIAAAGGIGLAGVLGFALLLHAHFKSQLKAAAELHEEREWFRTTLGSIGDAVVAADVRGRVTFLNPVAEHLTGWKQDQALGESLGTILKIENEETRLPVPNPAERALREGVVVGLANHTILISRDGVERPIDDSAAPIRDANNRIVGVVIVFHDVTEGRHAERLLREADRRKDHFLAVLSHELRNPMAPIRMALTLLRKQPVGPEQKELLDTLYRQSEQLTRLLDDLLDIGRINSGKITLRMETGDLRRSLTSAVEAAQPLIRQNAHELSVSLPDAPIPMRCDVGRMTQIFTNLLNNAAKYTKSGGRITLTATHAGDWAEVRIRDNGIGIPREHLRTVFEMFAQVDQSLERPHGGLGIGLSLARRLAELHGGTIEALSEGSGKGSEFVVRVPTGGVAAESNAEAARTTDTEQSGPQPPRPLRVIVADDNVDAARILERILTMQGHEVRVEHDGHGALQTAVQFRPDAVLLDISMPTLSGHEVARRLRSANLPDALLIAISGYGQKEDIERARQSGFDHHLTKPVDMDQLIKLLNDSSPHPGRG